MNWISVSRLSHNSECGISRYPSQQQVGGDSKIPTITYYDEKGEVVAVGAEAVREKIDHMSTGGLTKAE